MGRAIGMNVMVGIVNLIFTVLALAAIDRVGRRPLLLIATAGMGVCLAGFAAALAGSPTIPSFCSPRFWDT